MAPFSPIEKLQEKFISYEVVVSFAKRLFRKYPRAIKCSHGKFRKSERIIRTQFCP